jgi:hypothetical protein
MGDNLPKNFIWKIKALLPEKQSEMGQVKITVSDDFTEPISNRIQTKNSNFSPHIDNNTVKCYSN